MGRSIVKLKGIKQVTKPNGKVYTYRRVGGSLVRLPDLPMDDPEFLRAYADAAGEKPERARGAQGSIDWWISKFRASQDFAKRKASTQAVWSRMLDRMAQAHGSKPAARCETKHIEMILGEMTPGAARSARTVWRALFSYIKKKQGIDHNPAKDAEIDGGKTTPHPAWTEEEVAAFRAHWPIGSAERQAFEVICWTGARISDAARLGHQQVRDGILTYTQEKTGKPAYVPVTAPVEAFLEEDRAHFLEAISDDMIWILTRQRKPRDVSALGNLVRDAARAAGITKSAHGLRKYRATVLAEAHWPPHRIAAWTGHETLSEIEHYTRSASRRNMVTDSQIGNRVVDLGNRRR